MYVLLFQCNEECESCSTTQDNCTECADGYFKQYEMMSEATTTTTSTAATTTTAIMTTTVADPSTNEATTTAEMSATTGMTQGRKKRDVNEITKNEGSTTEMKKRAVIGEITEIMNMAEFKCVKKCEQGFYGNATTRMCYMCDMDMCAECSDNKVCQKCKDKMLLYDNTCVKQCPDKLRADSEQETCISPIESDKICDLLLAMGIGVCIVLPIVTGLVVAVLIIGGLAYHFRRKRRNRNPPAPLPSARELVPSASNNNNRVEDLEERYVRQESRTPPSQQATTSQESSSAAAAAPSPAAAVSQQITPPLETSPSTQDLTASTGQVSQLFHVVNIFHEALINL